MLLVRKTFLEHGNKLALELTDGSVNLLGVASAETGVERMDLDNCTLQRGWIAFAVEGKEILVSLDIDEDKICYIIIC